MVGFLIPLQARSLFAFDKYGVATMDRESNASYSTGLLGLCLAERKNEDSQYPQMQSAEDKRKTGRFLLQEVTKSPKPKF